MSGTSWVPSFDGYSGLVRIGRGGFSEVYRAHQDRLDRDVAIKVLSTDLNDPADVRRFETECRVLGRLGRHHNIVDVYDAGVSDDGRAFIVMKLYEGGTLGQRVLRDGPLPVADVIALGQKIAEALAAAHAEGVVHRDIKPENVLLDGRGEPVVSDFGVAAVADPDGRYTSSVAFSRAYVAPEVLDRNEYGVASDIYSYGATLYTLLTGRPVFQATTEARTVLAVLQDDPEPIDRDDVPDDLDALVMSCLAKSPQDRPADAATVKNALDSIATALGEPKATEVASVLGAAAVAPTLSEDQVTPSVAAAGDADAAGLASTSDGDTPAQTGSVDDEQLTVLRPPTEPGETSVAPAAATVAPSKSLLPPPAVPGTKALSEPPAADRPTQAAAPATSSRRTWLVPMAGLAVPLVLVAGVFLATRGGAATSDASKPSPASTPTTAQPSTSSPSTPSANVAPVAFKCWDGKRKRSLEACGTPTGPRGFNWLFRGARLVPARCLGQVEPGYWDCTLSQLGVPKVRGVLENLDAFSEGVTVLAGYKDAAWDCSVYAKVEALDSGKCLPWVVAGTQVGYVSYEGTQYPERCQQWDTGLRGELPGKRRNCAFSFDVTDAPAGTYRVTVGYTGTKVGLDFFVSNPQAIARLLRVMQPRPADELTGVPTTE